MVYMYVPSLIERVRVKGIEEQLLVARIDWNQRTAHLLSLKLAADVAYDVPFADIYPAGSTKNKPPKNELEVA